IFDYPIYSNFEDHKITIKGYNFLTNSFVSKEFSLLNLSANQTYFGSVNNYILNLFNNNNIIFPKFINFEFEFNDTDNANKLFGNYFGYFSNKHIIENHTEFELLKQRNINGIFSKEVIKNDKFVQEQSFNFNDSIYKSNIFTINTYDTNNTLPFARL